MSKKPSKKANTLGKRIPIELIYRCIELDNEIGGPALNRAFDILFEETLRRLEYERQNCGQMDV